MPVGLCLCRFVESGPASVLFVCLELPRKGSAKGSGICDARVEVHPVNWLTPEVENPETQTHFVHSGGRDSCTAFHWKSPTKEILRTAFGKRLPCGRLIFTHRSHMKRRCIKVARHSPAQHRSGVSGRVSLCAPCV